MVYCIGKVSLSHWAKFLLTLSFKSISATLLSAAIITRSFPLCSTAVAYCHVHMILWEWRERGRNGEKETEGGRGERDWDRDRRERERQTSSSMIREIPLRYSWSAPVMWDVTLLFLSHLAFLMPLKLWASCRDGCDFGVERDVILCSMLQLLHLIHSRKIKVCSSAGGKTGWVRLTEVLLSVLPWPFLRILRVILTVWFADLTSYKVTLLNFFSHFPSSSSIQQCLSE